MTDLHELRLREHLLAFVADPPGREGRISELFGARFPEEVTLLHAGVQERHLEAIRGRLAASTNGWALSWLTTVLRLRARPAPLRRDRWQWAAAFVAASILLVLLVLNLPGILNKNTIAEGPPNTTQPGPLTPNNVRPKGPSVKIEKQPGPLRPLKDSMVRDKPAPRLVPKGGRKPDGLLAAKVEVGTFGAVTGEPTFRLPGGAASTVLPKGPLYAGAIIETGDMDKAEIVFADGTTVAMDYNTTLLLPDQVGQISQLGQTRPIRPEEITVTNGVVSVVAVHEEDSSKFAVKTPVATATVVGTRFSLGLLRSERDLKAVLRVYEGKVAFANAFDSVLADANTESTATRSSAPTPPKRMAILGFRHAPGGGNVKAWGNPIGDVDRPDFVRKFVFRLGWAGVTAATLPERGVTIIGLSQNASARAGGLRIGDVVLAVDGKPLDKAENLHRLIHASPDRWMALTLQREGEVSEIKFLVGASLPTKTPIKGSREFLARLHEATAPALAGEAERAVLALTALSKQAPAAPVFNNLGLAHHMRNDMGSAIRNFQAAVRLAPNEPLYRHNLGFALSLIGNMDRAIEELGAAAALAPGDYYFLIGLTRALNVAGRSEEAIALLGRRTYPDNSVYWTDVATTLHTLGRNEEAVAAAERAVKIAPDHADAYTVLHFGLRQLGRGAEAETAVRTAIELDPTDWQAWGALALLLESFGRLEESESAFRKAILFYPNPVDYRNLAVILRKLGRGKEAEPTLLKSIELDPTYPLSYESLGFLYMQELGRLDEAETMFRKAIALDPGFESTYWGMAELSFRRGDAKTAEPMLRKAIELNPTNPSYHHNLGILLMQSGHGEEAEKELRKAMELDPKNSARRIAMSSFLKNQGDLTGAEAVLREGLKQAPDDAPLLNALALRLAEHGAKLDEALDFAQRSVKAAPADPHIRATLGWVYYRRGEFGLAEEHLTKSIELHGKSPGASDVWVRLGAVFERKNEVERARDAYRKALSLQPNNREAAEALKRIGSP